MTKAIEARVDRVMQQTLQRDPVGRPPLQLPALVAPMRPHRDPNVVLHQPAQQATHRTLALELSEEQTHDLLHLFVRIKHQGARTRVLEVADGRMTVEGVWPAAQA